MNIDKATLKQIGIVLAILLLVYLVGRYTMKKKAEAEGKKPIRSEDLPNSGSGIPEGWTPENLIVKLRESLKGLSVGWMSGRNLTLYTELNALTDDQFTAVFKGYKNKYDRSLKDDISDEWVVYGTQTHVKAQLIIQKAERLEL